MNSESNRLITYKHGTIAAAAQAGDRWTFFEIDPAVVRIAHDHFSFLSRSAGDFDIALGDARRSISVLEDSSFGLLILDAFSSDAVPTHLLTVEALETYVRKLTPAGLLAVHVSNH